jgi:hypothetical protein
MRQKQEDIFYTVYTTAEITYGEGLSSEQFQREWPLPGSEEPESGGALADQSDSVLVALDIVALIERM